MHQTQAEGQNPVSGIMNIVNMPEGIVVKGVTQVGITRKGRT